MNNELKKEEQVAMGIMEMQRDLVAKIHDVVVAKNYPLAIVVASLEYLKTNYTLQPMFDSIVKGKAKETTKLITDVSPELRAGLTRKPGN